MNDRRVVIVDYIYDFPNKEQLDAEELQERKDLIWESRLRELERNYNQKFAEVACFAGLFYPSVEEHFPLRHIQAEKSKFLLSSERISLNLFQTLADRNVVSPKSNLLVSVGSSQTDNLSKFALMGLEGDELEKAVELIDPLGYLKLLQWVRPPALETISEASTSGIGAMYSAYSKIKKGEFDVAITGGASAVTFPSPYELSHFGTGDTRAMQPFEEGASGHHFSEGGVAVLLKEREQALVDGDTILAEIKDISAGTMGNPVVNRTAIKKLVSRSLANAGIGQEAEIFLELYGRGNEIDDTAEFSCLRNLQKNYTNLRGGFLKEDVHYIVGYYGQIGMCRLLDSVREHSLLQGREIKQPNSFIGRITDEQWSQNVSEFDLVSILSYSMHGNSYNLLLGLNEGDGDVQIEGRDYQ